ncbi:MAG: trigger factor family protein [Muribaculaceae bacterium]|jgi:trigger factor|nr:trigger factor family protein [Muribaculaceae bacterium]
MNVTLEKTGNVTGIITVLIEQNDYQEKVDKELRKIGREHPLAGFRAGHVPFGLLKKLYGKDVLAQELNGQFSDALSKYIYDNKLNVLGEPLSADEKPLDLASDKDFTMKFEVGLAPEINFTLDKNVKIPFYNINVDDDMISKQDENMRRRYGKQEPGDVADDTALVKGSMVELNEDGTPKEGGVNVEKTIVSPEYVQDKDQKAKFIGCKVGDKVVFNPWATTGGNISEMASMLNVDNADAEVKSDFEMTVAEIIVNHPAELGQEYYDQAFGKDAVKSEDEYKAKVKEMIANQLKGESNYRFTIDAENVIKEKVGALELPAEFLKKWLLKSDSKRNPDTIDDDFNKMVPDLEWQLIKEKIVADNNIKVEEADMLAVAKVYAYQQFSQYGMTNIPDDIIEKYAKEMMGKDENRRGIAEKAVEEKLYSFIRGNVTVDEKNVSVKEFNELFAKK